MKKMERDATFFGLFYKNPFSSTILRLKFKKTEQSIQTISTVFSYVSGIVINASVGFVLFFLIYFDVLFIPMYFVYSICFYAIIMCFCFFMFLLLNYGLPSRNWTVFCHLYHFLMIAQSTTIAVIIPDVKFLLFFCCIMIASGIFSQKNGLYELWYLFLSVSLLLFSVYEIVLAVISKKEVEKKIFLSILNFFFNSLCFTITFTGYKTIFQKQKFLVSNVIEINESLLKLDFKSKKIQNIINTKDELFSGVLLTFKQIIQNLIEYKNYLPSHLLSDYKSEFILPKNNSEKLNSDALTVYGSDEFSISSLESEKESVCTPKHKKMVITGFKKKIGTFMLVDLSREYENLGEDSEDSMFTIQNKVISLLFKIINEYKGDFYHINGGEYYITFGLKERVIDHEINTCFTAIKIKDELEKLKFVPKIFCFGGNCVVGNCGIEGFRRFIVHNEKKRLIKSLASFGKYFVDGVILIGEKIYERVKYFSKCYLIAEKMDNCKIYELIEVKKVVENEWIYEISSTFTPDPVELFNCAVEKLQNGDFKGSSEILMKLKDVCSEKCVLNHFQMLKKILMLRSLSKI